MDTIVLDTNVVSYLLKKHTLAERYRPHLVDHLADKPGVQATGDQIRRSRSGLVIAV